MTGTVRWWNCDRGWGFAQVDGHPDVFVHHAAFDEEVDLLVGEELVFDVVPGHVGSVAANARLA